MRGKRNEAFRPPVEVVVIKKRRGRPPKIRPEETPAAVTENGDQVSTAEQAWKAENGALASEQEWNAAAPGAAPAPEASTDIGAGAASIEEVETSSGKPETDGEQLVDQDGEKTGLGNPATLAGDMRDSVLNHVMRQEKVWSKMLNYEQAVLADQIYKICKTAIDGAMKIILDVPFAHVDVTIDKIAVDKGIKVNLSAPAASGALGKLGDHLHSQACLILASAAEFQGQQRAAKTDPDEPALQLEEVQETSEAA